MLSPRHLVTVWNLSYADDAMDAHLRTQTVCWWNIGKTKLVAIGGVIGLALALLVTRALSQMLFGIGAFEPVTFLAIPTLLGGVAVLAAYIPARRASRIDPVSALRTE